jgi:hypothetical protein
LLLLLLSGGDEARNVLGFTLGFTSALRGLIPPFDRRVDFTGVYRNEARSETCFFTAGMFSVQVFPLP